jgi:autotransporter adhesin
MRKLLLLLMLLPFGAWAHDHTHIDVYPTYTTQNITQNIEGVGPDAISLAIAATQLDFDYRTNAIQMGIGGGIYANEESIVIGFGQRINDEGMLRFSMGRADHEYGVGFGYTFRLE